MEWFKLGSHREPRSSVWWLPSVRKEELVSAVERNESRLGEKEMNH